MEKVKLLILLFILIGCKKTEDKSSVHMLAQHNLEIYLLKERASRNGKFDINHAKLQDKPFITDNEIQFLDINTKKICFEKSVAPKTMSLPKETGGYQFVVTDNKVPVFGGYFCDYDAAYRSEWNTVLSVHKVYRPKNDISYLIFDGKYQGSGNNKSIDFNKYRKFIQALEETNRLKK